MKLAFKKKSHNQSKNPDHTVRIVGQLDFLVIIPDWLF